MNAPFDHGNFRLSVRNDSASEWLKLLSPIDFYCEFEVNSIPLATLTLGTMESCRPGLAELDRDLEFTRPGEQLQIGITGGAQLFAGQVVRQQVEWRGDRPRITLKIGHALTRLPITPRSAIYHDCLDSEILDERLTSAGIPIQESGGLSQSHGQLAQMRQTDWGFIQSRVRANRCWLVPTLNGVKFVSPSLAVEPRQTFSRNGTTGHQPVIEKIDWEFGSQPRQVALHNWDTTVQSTSTATHASEPHLGRGALDPRLLKPLDRQGSLALEWTRSFSPAQRQGLADASLLAQRANGVQCRITIVGSASLNLGETIRLDGFGQSLDGDGIVTRIAHVMRKGLWRTELGIGQVYLRDADPAVASGGVDLVVGVIDSPGPDPEELQRIAVKLPTWAGAPTIWARWATPFASKDSGLCLYPEQGDEVVLAFFEGDASYPVILGSMFNPRNLPPIAFSEESMARGLVVGGAETGLRLLLNAEQTTLEVGNGANALRLLEEAVSLSASESDITIAGAAITVTGESIDLDAA